MFRSLLELSSLYTILQHLMVAVDYGNGINHLFSTDPIHLTLFFIFSVVIFVKTMVYIVLKAHFGYLIEVRNESDEFVFFSILFLHDCLFLFKSMQINRFFQILRLVIRFAILVGMHLLLLSKRLNSLVIRF